MVFNYLDSDSKGFISYLDFCELAEERRRNLDSFDVGARVAKFKDDKEKKNWNHTYLDDANIYDLELMSKRMQTKN